MFRLLILLNVFFVSFTDKPASSTPALSERAIAQRTKWNIEMDELDYPVNAAYLDSLRQYGAVIHHTSRWMNGATCSMTDKQATSVATRPFVASVEMTRDNSSSGMTPKRRSLPLPEQQKTPHLLAQTTDDQLALYNLQPLHELGYYGQGIQMAICDGGFTNVNTLSCFRQDLELGHFDFTDDADDFYGETSTHGTYCLSAISGLTDEYTGAATQAQYYLMRSEEAETESPKEMDNLVVALETADSIGINIFSTSLGYVMFDHSEWDLGYVELDGKATRVSRAATIAARKGMLVCVAAGNNSNKDWHWINSPADADSILTIGAVDTEGVICDFSCYGPTADGRIKPEVCALGKSVALINQDGNITNGNGTSYAAALLAGMAAVLWSALPDESAMQIRERIIRSADRHDTPDDQYGYGIPDAYAAYQGAVATDEKSISINGVDIPIHPSETGQTDIDILGDSTLMYDPEENTLTFNSLTMEVGEDEGTAISYSGEEPLTIVLNDESSIIADTVIASTGDIIITGTGSLVAEGTVPIIGEESANITFDSVNMYVHSLPSAAAVRRRIRGVKTAKDVDENGGPALSGFGNADFNKVNVSPSGASYGAVSTNGESGTEILHALYVQNGDGSQTVVTEFTLTAIPDDNEDAVETIRNTHQPFDPTLPMYNILGVQVDAAYKGLVIQGGQTYLLR